METAVKLLASYYESTGKFTFAVSLFIGLMFGLALFFAGKVSAAKVAADRVKVETPAIFPAVSGQGNGNANTGQNNGTVTVNNK